MYTVGIMVNYYSNKNILSGLQYLEVPEEFMKNKNPEPYIRNWTAKNRPKNVGDSFTWNYYKESQL